MAPDRAEAKAPPQEAIAEQRALGDYFRWRPVPWWLAFALGIFLLTKLQLVYNDSPCAVLGTQSPVNTTDVKRAFRVLSMCTHPDRLRGRLGRSPTAAEERRGEIIFNRASAAKDHLTKALKRKKTVNCYEGELEMALLAFVTQAGAGIGSLGLNDYYAMVVELFWNIVTFEAGFFNTCLSVLWLTFVFKLVKQFLMFLWSMGIIRGSVALVTTIVIGPLPTVINFIALPVIRLLAFLKELSGTPETEKARAEPPVSGDRSGENAAANAAPVTMTAGLAAATEKTDRGVLRQRKKKETEEEKEQRNKALLAGQAEAPVAGSLENGIGAGPMPEGLWKCVIWAHKEPVKARQAAANAVQFDLLLILTKPVIPLFMLIALGQVWNGLFSSLFIGHALRRWVPQMSYEAHHLLVSFFGMMHTLLGVSAHQVEDYANREGTKILHLAWSWSFKDVLSVMHMCQLGATVTAMSALGNEPSFAASFAAGIAMRMALAQDSIRGLGLVKSMASMLEGSFRDLGIAIDATEEVVAYSGDGIGDCGGGPFRMMLGDGPEARWAALLLKAWLMLLPLLSTLQWGQRALHAGRMLGKRWKLTRFVQRVILFLLGLVQVYLIANMELNASNGTLGNFWIAMLFGCAGESLMSTYDIRGSVRQIVFLVLFLLI